MPTTETGKKLVKIIDAAEKVVGAVKDIREEVRGLTEGAKPSSK